MSPIEIRARVFISCGQAKGTDEEATAQAIAARLKSMGFDTYVAVQEQSLKGLKDNIFRQLEKSEYFLFVDFKREILEDKVPPIHRGSLFSHQELGLASYLDIEVLAFQESGVKTDDGIIRFLHANAIPFTERSRLADMVAEKVVQRPWDPRWKNELVLERDPKQFTDANRVETVLGQQPRYFQGRFFHIDVHNRHRTKVATNCYAYLAQAIDLETSKEIPFKTIEFKWAGYIWPNAHILPQQSRRFDAFWIAHDKPTTVQFNVYSDATDYIPLIEGDGTYKLKYVVVSDNFPASEGSFILTLNKSLGVTTFRPA